VYEPSLYERIGGIAGVEAIARAVHQRIRSDPDVPVILDDTRARNMLQADVRLLTDALRGRPSRDPRRGGVLVQYDVATRHLRDALWLLGTSGALVDEITGAVLGAIAVEHC
jgi:hypothetical protein